MARSLSRAQFDGLIIIPTGADVGVTESGEPFQTHSAKPSWNGLPIISGPSDARREVITLSADGTRWGPTFDAIHARDVVVLHSGRFDAALIPTGATSVILRRPPVPDPNKPWGYAVLARRLDEPKRLLPVVVSGRLVTIEVEQDVPVSVQYRPIRPLRVLQVMPPSADLVRGTQSWGLKGVDLT